jgi:hypothetical protein
MELSARLGGIGLTPNVDIANAASVASFAQVMPDIAALVKDLDVGFKLDSKWLPPETANPPAGILSAFCDAVWELHHIEAAPEGLTYDKIFTTGVARGQRAITRKQMETLQTVLIEQMSTQERAEELAHVQCNSSRQLVAVCGAVWLQW